MTTPMIDERRPDAHVVVYGDASPITEQEWHCARLAWSIFGVAVTIRREGVWSLTVDSADSFFLYVRSDRADVVAVCVAKFQEIAQRYADGAKRGDKRAARLRALLAGVS